MTGVPDRIEVTHSCALCGAPAALPAEGGMQLSVIDQKRRVAGWAVHQECLAAALAPTTRVAFTRAFGPDAAPQ
jgi:hypothetical protein